MTAVAASRVNTRVSTIAYLPALPSLWTFVLSSYTSEDAGMAYQQI